MKILHVITGLATGGAERALYNVLAGGLAERFDTAVVSLRDGGTMGQKIEALGVPLFALDMTSGVPGPKVLLKLRGVVRAFQPDVIQGWMYHGNLAATVAAWMGARRTKVAWNVRQSLYDLKAEKRLTRQVIRCNRYFSDRADAVIYNSRVSKAQHETFGFAQARGQIIPNGFDLEQLRPQPDVGLAVRQELSIPSDALVVGHVARFHPMKDHVSFLRAAVQVVQAIPDAYFLLVGREVSPDNPALANIVPPENMGSFMFARERMDVPRLMQAMDVFCLSSWSEAFPNVLGEAMATQVPCVTTDVGDSSDIVGSTGIVVPPLDSAVLAEALVKILRMPSEQRLSLGAAARKRVQNNYSLMAVVDVYAGLYEGIAKGSSE